MNQPSNARLKRRVWRITSDAPQGEYVDPDEGPREQSEHVASGELAERSEPTGWLESAFDLAHGLEVSEELDTVPDALLDDFFKR